MCRWNNVVLGVLLSSGLTAAEAQPAFDCAKAQGQVEQLICKDAGLAALDRTLDGVYRAATAKAKGQPASPLRSEQRGWIGGRNECWKATDANNAVFLTASWTAASVRGCVEAKYRMRIAELQSFYRLVTPQKPTFYACDNNPSNEVVATFFDTDPPTAQLERGDTTITAYQVRTASGAKYEGQNVTFSNNGNAASVSWTSAATGVTEKLECKVRQ